MCSLQLKMGQKGDFNTGGARGFLGVPKGSSLLLLRATEVAKGPEEAAVQAGQ